MSEPGAAAGTRPQVVAGAHPGHAGDTGHAGRAGDAGHTAGEGDTDDLPVVQDDAHSRDAVADGRAPGTSGATTAPAPERPRLTLRERLALSLQLRYGARARTLAALAVVLVLAAVLAAHHFWSGRPRPVSAPPPRHAASPPTAADTRDVAPSAPTSTPRTGGGGDIVVDVAGKVRRPGLYRLPAGSRVDDALRAAGGVRKGTDATGVNRARLLNDGEQLLVGVVPAPGATAADASSAGTGAGPETPVSLNTATAEQLQTLPGVGPVLAQHILEYRQRHGGFSDVDQLREVNGIGERRFADLAPRVTP